MNPHDLLRLGVPKGPALRSGMAFITHFMQQGGDANRLCDELTAVLAKPSTFTDDPLRGTFARDLAGPVLAPDPTAVPWRQWGADLDPAAVQQMTQACSLPVAVAGALMPDAHLGYGLPIGGVLATEDCVIPYAVGVDIACRMRLSILDRRSDCLDTDRHRLAGLLETETNFGVGGTFANKRQHDVLDEDWNVSPVTRQCRDKAWAQLGTSGSGNHFVEFGEFRVTTVQSAALAASGFDLPAGNHLALLSHSGSRGTGAQVCQHYSRLAMSRHADLPRELKHLAWLSLQEEAGQEYWAAMNLMGRYAAANHELIHRHLLAGLGAEAVVAVENHHNFAWRETQVIGGRPREVIVHRKGATPAGAGVLGVIPGSMATPGFLVRGRGHPESLRSASHGAGRVMSRTRALQSFRWQDVQQELNAAGVQLLSAGLDEVPGVYKDIHTVMAAQQDLIEVLGRFQPRIVKMCPSGEKPED